MIDEKLLLEYIEEFVKDEKEIVFKNLNYNNLKQLINILNKNRKLIGELHKRWEELLERSFKKENLDFVIIEKDGMYRSSYGYEQYCTENKENIIKLKLPLIKGVKKKLKI